MSQSRRKIEPASVTHERMSTERQVPCQENGVSPIPKGGPAVAPTAQSTTASP